MEHTDNTPNMNRNEDDLLIPVVNHDPEGKPVYHPAIGKGALGGGLVGGILISLLAWLVASGVWPVEGLGQLSAGGRGAASLMGFIIGSAMGGLAGSLSGLAYMLSHPAEPSTELK